MGAGGVGLRYKYAQLRATEGSERFLMKVFSEPAANDRRE